MASYTLYTLTLVISLCYHCILPTLSLPIRVQSDLDVIDQPIVPHKFEQGNTRPTVLWHGMGDTCCFPFSMGRLTTLIQQNLPGVYVYSIQVGSSIEEDQWNGFFMNVNDQVDFVCQKLASDPKLAKGFNAIGFSQGSQFLRAYVERCNNPPVYNLISIGGQHQGVYGMPKCPGANYTWCEYMRSLLNYGAYIKWIQDFLVQAEYWHDPFNEASYVKDCIFLPDINNEGPKKNQTYKDNLTSLNRFVMTKFTEDSMVQPIESEWFGFYKPGQDVEVIDMRDTTLYKEDWIGLKQLDEAGKLVFFTVEGDHLKFTDTWFINNIVNGFLNNTIS